MKKILGILGLLVAICVFTAIVSPQFLLVGNIENLVHRTALVGILSIGAAFVIITGGIDLSIGSVVCLVGVLLPWMLAPSFPVSDTPLTVEAIDRAKSTLVLSGRIEHFKPGDRLQVSLDDELRMLEVKSAGSSQGDATVVIEAVPTDLVVGTQMHAAHKHVMNVGAAVAIVLGLATFVGLCHGLLITRMRLQPFVVTLCGLLLYRGIARGITHDQSQGFGTEFKPLRSLATERLPIFGTGDNVFHLPATVLIVAVIGVLAAIFLNQTIYGRYLLALGRNEQAARYSGINTNRMVLLAYVVCAALAGLGGMLYVLDINAAQPSDFGNFYELYAIAAAVLGGCSLRGGEGSITGVLVGAGVMVVLSNMINLRFPEYQNMEFAIIGAVILLGVIADELVKRFAARRRAIRSAAVE